MRNHAIAFVVLTLAACGAAGDVGKQAPTLELPLTAPENTPQLVADFIEICSVAMDDPVKGAAALGRREGWSTDGAQGAGMALAGLSMAEHDDTGVQIQIVPSDFPHLETVNCQLNAFPRDGVLDEVDLSPEVFGDIEGFIGDVRTLPMPEGGRMMAARYSGVAANGDIIIIGANLTPNFDMLFMGRSTERMPETNTQDNK